MLSTETAGHRAGNSWGVVGALSLPFRGSSEWSVGLLGALVGVSLGVLLGLSRCPLGAFLHGLWALLGLLSGSRDPLWALLGLFWGPLGSLGGLLGAILETIGHKRGGY